MGRKCNHCSACGSPGFIPRCISGRWQCWGNPLWVFGVTPGVSPHLEELPAAQGPGQSLGWCKSAQIHRFGSLGLRKQLCVPAWPWEGSSSLWRCSLHALEQSNEHSGRNRKRTEFIFRFVAVLYHPNSDGNDLLEDYNAQTAARHGLALNRSQNGYKIQRRSYNIKNKKLHKKLILKRFQLWCEEDILYVKKISSAGPWHQPWGKGLSHGCGCTSPAEGKTKAVIGPLPVPWCWVSLENCCSPHACPYVFPVRDD